MSNAALTASVWLMCALIFDRYRTICRPFTRSSQTTGKVHKVLGLVCLLALIFSLPRFYELTLVHDHDANEYYLDQTELVRNKLYMIGYRILGGLLLYSLFPYVILFLLSFKVGFNWKSMRVPQFKGIASVLAIISVY